MRSASIDAGGAGKATLSSYLTGFVLAVILTLIAFALVMSGALPQPITVGGIFAAAVAQIIVHLHYFLHLDRSSEQRWNMLALVFTAVVVLIVVGGSIWIMFNLHARMMLG
ncbi:MAG: cytochrome o ubiquinol oxidase subunit IV [Gemmataceae bacterium]